MHRISTSDSLRKSSIDIWETLHIKKIPEDKVRVVIRQLASALKYIHALKIVHGDLKLENILIDSNFYTKLIDFGGAIVLNDVNQPIASHHFLGTTQYAPPEIESNDKYFPIPGEMWCLGCVLFTMLTGSRPFKDKNFFKKAPLTRKVSPEAHDLISLLLSIEPTGRITAEEVLNHPFCRVTEANS